MSYSTPPLPQSRQSNQKRRSSPTRPARGIGFGRRALTGSACRPRVRPASPTVPEEQPHGQLAEVTVCLCCRSLSRPDVHGAQAPRQHRGLIKKKLGVSWYTTLVRRSRPGRYEFPPPSLQITVIRGLGLARACSAGFCPSFDHGCKYRISCRPTCPDDHVSRYDSKESSADRGAQRRCSVISVRQPACQINLEIEGTPNQGRDTHRWNFSLATAGVRRGKMQPLDIKGHHPAFSIYTNTYL